MWGDARLSNLVYRDFEVVAVLDWEMASHRRSAARPRLVALRRPRAHDRVGLRAAARLPVARTTAERWSRLTGRSTEALGYYELLAGLRFTVIMLRMGKLLARHGPGPTDFAYDNLISVALAELLDAPLLG